MKILTLIITLSLLVLQNYSQSFKNIQTAQDVIDNFIMSNGGVDNLSKVKSIKSDASMELGGIVVPVDIYVSERYFYFNIGIPQFPFISAFDFKERIGWTKIGSKINDAKEEEFKNNVDAVASMLWRYYIDKEKYGISYKLLQNEIVNEKECYVVELVRGENVIETVYFDSETFSRVKLIKDFQTSDYSDFRNVSETGIYMPYLIKTAQGDIRITSYLFNKEFNRSLLKKPKGEEQ